MPPLNNHESRRQMGNNGEMVECPELNQSICKSESSECLLLSRGAVAKVFVPYVKGSLVPFSE